MSFISCYFSFFQHPPPKKNRHENLKAYMRSGAIESAAETSKNNGSGSYNFAF